MNTPFLLLAQYNGAAVIPLDQVCRDYFQHLTPEHFARKVSTGDIAIPLVRIDTASAKTARGVHLMDLAAWIDERRAAAQKECRQLTGVDYAGPTPKLRPLDTVPTPGQTERSKKVWESKRRRDEGL